MDAKRLGFTSRAIIALSTLLLAAVMLACIPQGQALAIDTATETQSNMRLTTFGDNSSADLQATEATYENAPRQASGIKAKYGLLMKDGTIYPCNSKGKKLGKSFKAGSTVKVVFVAKNVKKVPALSNTKYWVYPSYGKITAKIKTLKFLGEKSSVTTIAKNAYSGHSYLTKVVNLNKTKVTTIPEGAFANTSLKSITLPNKLKKIGKDAFYKTKIAKIAVPKTLVTIGGGAFESCSKLTAVTGLEKTRVTKIGAYAFAESGIKSIALPAKLTSIGEGAFYKTSKLKTVKGLNKTGVKTISAYAFTKSGISAISFPGTLTSIGDYAFNTCTSLTSITLPQKFTAIGYAAFNSCSALATVNIQATAVVSTSYNAFGYTKMDGSSATGRIYVPAELVDAYKADGNWQYYAACITNL